jgi:MFS family permease
VDEAVEHFGFGTFHARIAVITGLVFMSDALEMMCLVTLTTALGCDWVISRREMTILATCVFSGWALGGFVWGQFADKYGRRQGLILSTFVAFYFGILSSLAPNLYWLMALRGLVGFGVGGSSVAFTLFAEYSQTKLRAKMSLWLLFFWPLGSCFEVGSITILN